MNESFLIHLQFWLPLLGLFTGAFATLVAAQFLYRVVAGASLHDLWRDRFFECMPLRAAIGIGRAVLWVAFASSLVALGRALWLVYAHHQRTNRFDERLCLTAGAALAAAIALPFVRRAIRRWLASGKPVPPSVDTRIANIAEGIPTGQLSGLGLESFPSPESPLAQLGLWIRRLIVTLLGLMLLYLTAVLLWHFAHLGSDERFANWPVLPLPAVLAWLAELRSAQFAGLSLRTAASASYCAATVFLILRMENRHYLLLRWPGHWGALLSCAGITASGMLAIFGPSAGLGCIALLLALIMGRLRADLRLARQAKRHKHVVSPLAAALAEQCPFLPAIPGRARAHYPPLDEKEIGRRITRGAKNLEAAGWLVRRHFGRFMQLGQVRYQRSAICALRYLGVGRSAVLGSGWSTIAGLRWPKVNVWDLDLYPLQPHAGYTTVTQTLELGTEWNVVVTCGTCGGRGTVDVTENYTEYETRYETEYVNGESRSVTKNVQVSKTRTVPRTCSSCSGTGRLEHRQLIETRWRPFQASIAEPVIPRPELCEGAEETVFFDLPYLEGMHSVPAAKPASMLPDPLATAMARAGAKLAGASDRNTPQVLKLLGSDYVYRSGFVVYGFHTLYISFSGFLSRSGWFFGRRPEFHFPRLPLSIGALATHVFAPPAAVWVTIQSLLWAFALLNAI